MPDLLSCCSRVFPVRALSVALEKSHVDFNIASIVWCLTPIAPVRCAVPLWLPHPALRCKCKWMRAHRQPRGASGSILRAVLGFPGRCSRGQKGTPAACASKRIPLEAALPSAICAAACRRKIGIGVFLVEIRPRNPQNLVSRSRSACLQTNHAHGPVVAYVLTLATFVRCQAAQVANVRASALVSASPFLESCERRVQVKSRNGTSHICRNVGERAALPAVSSAATSCCASWDLFTDYHSCTWSRVLTSLDTQGSPPPIDAMGRDPHGGARTVAGGVGGWAGEALLVNTGSSLPSFLAMKLQNDSAQMQGGRFE